MSSRSRKSCIMSRCLAFRLDGNSFNGGLEAVAFGIRSRQAQAGRHDRIFFVGRARDFGGGTTNSIQRTRRVCKKTTGDRTRSLIKSRMKILLTKFDRLVKVENA